jgi:hypothetical protein
MRIAALKAQKKAEMVTIRLTVWIYPEGHTKATKASFSTIQEAVRGHENADSILDTLINRAADAYRRCPAYKDDDLDLEALFLRDNINLSVQQSQSSDTSLDDNELNCTLSELLNNLKAANKLSDKDAKGNCLNLRCFVFQGVRADPSAPSPEPKRRKRKASRSS